MNRRDFVKTAGLALGGSLGLGSGPFALAQGPRSQPPRSSDTTRKKVAAVVTVYTERSHAYHIVGRFLHGFMQHGVHHQPPFEVVSLYADQLPRRDLSRELAEMFGFRHCQSVEEALTVGGDSLAIDAVLLIGEHGDYPRNEKGQQLYPRHRLFSEIVAVFRKTGHSVPVFNDKHFSYSWEQAAEMVGWSRELGFPLVAGSSLPHTWRLPELELPLETPIEDALVAGYGGNEAYGFHALETLQCMIERRKGGETGVKAVTLLEGDAVWKAGDDGRWSWDLLEHALGRSHTLNIGDVRYNVKRPALFLIEYRDGLRGAVLMLNDHVADFTFAAQIKGQVKPVSALFYLPDPPGANYFDCLCLGIERTFTTGKPDWPTERTLLTTGILAAGMDSAFDGNQRLETPHLDVAYHAPAESHCCRGDVGEPVE